MNLLASHEVEYIGARPSQVDFYRSDQAFAHEHTIATFGRGEKHIIKWETEQKEVLGVSGDIKRIQESYINVRTIKNKKDCLVKEKHRYEHRFDIKS